MKIRAISICAAALFSTQTLAAEHQFKKGEAVSIQQNEGYVLVRTFQKPGGALRGAEKFSPILIRAASDDEMQQAEVLAEHDPKQWKDKVEPNVVEPLADQPYEEKSGEEFLLLSLKPGSYVLGGLAVTNWASKSTGVLLLSLCMGTAEFEVKPGVITDLGAILVALDDQPTTIPELSKVVAGKPTGFVYDPWIMGVRHATPDMEMPEKLRSLRVMPADYQAVGVSPNYLGGPIGRLAPLPGVLDYDADGNVIDLKAANGANQPNDNPPSDH